MPPRIKTGAARPQLAAASEAQNGGRGSARSSSPKPWRRDIHTTGAISAMPASTPGTMPAANSAGTEAPGTLTL
jgi:hypothetical protein